MNRFACLAAAALLLCGCSQPPLSREKAPDVSARLDESGKALGGHAKGLTDDADKIDDGANAILKQAPETRPSVEQVKDASADVRSRAVDVGKVGAELAAAQRQIENLHKFAVAAQAERDRAIARAEKAESAANAWERKTLAGIKIASGLAVVVSIALMALGTFRTAIPTFIAAALFAGSIAVSVAIEYQLIIGIGCGVVVVGALAYELWVKKRSISEIVETVDATLRDSSDKLPKALADNAALAQSAITKKLIDGAQGNGPINKLRRWLGGFIAGQPVAVKV